MAMATLLLPAMEWQETPGAIVIGWARNTTLTNVNVASARLCDSAIFVEWHSQNYSYASGDRSNSMLDGLQPKDAANWYKTIASAE